MAHLLKNLTNSIWHAFHALQTDAINTVAKSKLKVLTANIGTLMDLYGVEKGLEHYRSTQNLTFDQYIYYLQKEVFSSITDATSVQTLKTLEEGIDEVCWLICKKIYLERSHPVFEDNSVYQLFRIYCLLAETELDATDSYVVIMHGDEVAQIASHLVMSLGLQWDAVDFSALSAAIGMFRFPTFLAVLESKYSGGNALDIIALTEAIDDLYQIYVENVVKKGYLMKKGFLLPTLRYFWFVLRPGELAYYKDPQQKEPSGLILLNANCWADALTNSGKPDRRFVLSTPEHRCIELVAEDHKGRLQWLAALQTAIQHSGEKIGYQRSLANQRRSLRQATKQEKEETKLELQYERQARIAAEIQARKLEALSKEEGAKVQQLEDVKQKLELLLQEEKQALRDEEIGNRLLHLIYIDLSFYVRLYNLDILHTRKIPTYKLSLYYSSDAELRLQQLEAEREHLDAELRAAREKVKRAEEAQLVLEAQIVTRPLRGAERIRRTQSFMPTTKERPLSIEKIDRLMTLQKNV
ncbi:differentially expressed in FDCP 6 homolog [Pogonomyrmex barbatus]|uniref:Differentially expressed in FDCP 6 homolog n=1 Tax=Pogonomyrmex barbatus TaxID=144034 RepID=A0A6I9WTR9_9HYME|nr:differentially expressed in FDCP 6 homolog [Pogonomyrmex barbatus]